MLFLVLVTFLFFFFFTLFSFFFFFCNFSLGFFLITFLFYYLFYFLYNFNSFYYFFGLLFFKFFFYFLFYFFYFTVYILLFFFISMHLCSDRSLQWILGNSNCPLPLLGWNDCTHWDRWLTARVPVLMSLTVFFVTHPRTRFWSCLVGDVIKDNTGTKLIQSFQTNETLLDRYQVNPNFFCTRVATKRIRPTWKIWIGIGTDQEKKKLQKWIDWF